MSDDTFDDVGEISRQQARLRFEVSAAEADVVSGELWALGTIGIEEQQTPSGVVLLAGFASAQDADRVAGLLGRFTVLEEFGSGDYLDRWREYATVQRAGNRIVVRPPWVPHDVQPVELVLHIEPGRSFGSGSHPSTRLALAALEQVLEGNERVLDVGCGSGVLSVAAARLGAVDVVAIDIDPDAPRLTLDNARRNGVGAYITASNRTLAEVTGRFEVVVANMLAVTLRELGPELVSRVKPGRRLILAGLLAHQAESVAAACAPLKLLKVSPCPVSEGEWVGLTLG